MEVVLVIFFHDFANKERNKIKVIVLVVIFLTFLLIKEKNKKRRKSSFSHFPRVFANNGDE